MSLRVLITGGAGHLGSTLANALTSRYDASVLVLDDLSTGSKDNLARSLSRGAEFERVDVNDPAAVRAVVGSRSFDFVFHYAALVGVQETLARPADVFRDLKGLETVLRLSVEREVRRVFFMSSSEVYPPGADLPLREDEAFCTGPPQLPYALTKFAGEAMLRAFRDQFGLHFTIARAFNTYGPCQRTDFVVPRFLRAALKGADLVLYGDGKQTRTFLHVDEHVECILRCLDQKKTVDAIINIGSDVEITMSDLANMIVRLTRSSSRITLGPARSAGDVRRRRPEITRMRNWLEVSPRSPEDGLQLLLNQVKEAT